MAYEGFRQVIGRGGDDLALRAPSYVAPTGLADPPPQAPGGKKKSLLGPILNVVGTVVGSMVGMPMLGSILGGAAGGAVGGGGLKGALLGGLTGGLGYGAGGAITKAIGGLGGAAAGAAGSAAGHTAGSALSAAGSAGLGSAAASALPGTIAGLTVTAPVRAGLGGALGSLGAGALTSAAGGGATATSNTGGTEQPTAVHQVRGPTMGSGDFSQPIPGVDPATQPPVDITELGRRGISMGSGNFGAPLGAVDQALTSQGGGAPPSNTVDELTVMGNPQEALGAGGPIGAALASGLYPPGPYAEEVGDVGQPQRPGIIEDTIGQTAGGVGADYLVNGLLGGLGLGSDPSNITGVPDGGYDDQPELYPLGGAHPFSGPAPQPKTGGDSNPQFRPSPVSPAPGAAISPLLKPPGGTTIDYPNDLGGGGLPAPLTAGPGANIGGGGAAPAAGAAPAELKLQGGFSPDIFPWRKMTPFAGERTGMA